MSPSSSICIRFFLRSNISINLGEPTLISFLICLLFLLIQQQEIFKKNKSLAQIFSTLPVPSLMSKSVSSISTVSLSLRKNPMNREPKEKRSLWRPPNCPRTSINNVDFLTCEFSWLWMLYQISAFLALSLPGLIIKS